MGPGEKAFRRAKRRQLLWSALMLYALAVVFVAASLTPHLAEWWLGVPVTPESDRMRDFMGVPFLSLLLAGFFGERQFNVPSYLSGRNASWLRTTPWRPGMRFPLQPRRIELSDVILFTPVLLVCAWISPRQLWMPVAAVAAVLVFRLLLINLIAEQSKVLVLALLLVLSCMLSMELSLRITVGCAALLVLMLGALKAKPEFELIEPEPRIDRFGGQPGWIRRQMPAVQHEPRQRGLGILIGCAFFWVVFCLMQLGQPDVKDQRFALAISFTVSLLIAVIRWGTYVGRHHAPISLRGRLHTRQWLIPSHDRVLIAPLISTMAVLCVLTLCLTLHVPFSVSTALLPAIALAICIECGPTLRNWTLTGQHHVPRTAMKEISFDSTPTARRR